MPNLSGGKWGSDLSLGTPGGEVTWSIVEGGTPGVRAAFGRFAQGSDITSGIDGFAPFDLEEQIGLAFKAWSDVADIQFKQIIDDSSVVGQGAQGDIRIAFGEIDGASGTNGGVAFFPSTSAENAPIAGDILIDVEEFGTDLNTRFSNEFLFHITMVHEIGHSTGLEHIESVDAVMNFDFIFPGFTGLQADDVAGAQALYGESPFFKETIIRGTPNNDILNGNDLSNLINGIMGDDRIVGRAGDDTLKGGGGADTIKGGGGSDLIFGNGGSDKIRGNGAADHIRSGGGEDLVFAGGGADSLNGGGGADQLRGGAGNDTLSGKRGDDTLVGNAGADVFQFRASDRNDTITDFHEGIDRIEIQSGAEAFAELTFSQLGADLNVSFGTGSVRLLSHNFDRVNDEDFIFT